MDFMELLRQRHSTRSFLADPVEPEKLQAILEAANAAPSAGNQQAYEIFLVSKPAKRAALAHAAYNQDFISQAPLSLVFCANAPRSSAKYGQRGAQLYALQDATIAATCALLATTAQGLATVWVGAFDDDGVWRVLGQPHHLVPVAILPIGYAAETPASTPRRKLEDLLHEVD